MSRHDYTKEEISINDYLIDELKTHNNLAEHMTSIMDSGIFINPQYAIDSIMSSEDRNSLMCYLTRVERYEDCQWLLDAYNKIFIKPENHSKSKII